MQLASKANLKLKSIFDSNKSNFIRLFKSENELEEEFENFKPPKISQTDLAE